MMKLWRGGVWVLLALQLIMVAGVWWVTSGPLIASGAAGMFIGFGRLFGFLAVTAALTQLLIMARAPWLEGAFGLDRLARWHRWNGYATIVLVLIHPLLLAEGYALAAGVGLVSQYIDFILHFDDVWRAGIAEILLVGVVISSVYIVRRRLKFESWYAVHLLTYVAIILAFGHQLAVGGSFTDYPWARTYWYALYGFVLANIVIFRLVWPIWRSVQRGLRVQRVQPEAPGVVSIYIGGRHLGRWRWQAGQFVLVRFLAPGLWWQEHPFSLSWAPGHDQVRLTVKNVGDYTAKLQQLPVSVRVLIAGPFGAFTRRAGSRTSRLYIAGGVGITPIRALIEEGSKVGDDQILVYGSEDAAHEIFAEELDRLVRISQLVRHSVYSRQPDSIAGNNRIDGARIERLVPDFRDREVYLCGPPAMMMTLIAELTCLGLSPDQLHYERFSLHADLPRKK